MGKFIHTLHWLNILFQSIFSLLFPIVLGLLFGYWLCRWCGVGEWIYALLIVLGVFSGLVSMVRFILTASRQVNALEDAEAQKQRHTKK